MTRHSREDALTKRQFEILYQSVDEMKPSKQLETKFIMMFETTRELKFKYR